MEFLNHSPLKGKKLQLMGGVVSLSLCLTPTGIGNGGIGSVIMSLVEDSPQTRLTSISVQFKRLGEIGIGKNGHHGAEMLQVIE